MTKAINRTALDGFRAEIEEAVFWLLNRAKHDPDCRPRYDICVCGLSHLWRKLEKEHGEALEAAHREAMGEERAAGAEAGGEG